MKKRTGIQCQCGKFFHLPDDLYIRDANAYPSDIQKDKIATQHSCKYQGFIICANCGTYTRCL